MRTVALLAALAVAAPAAAQGPAPAPDLTPAPGVGAPRVLTLEEAIRTARQNQPQLRQARASTEASSARADQARSYLLPQVNASGAYTRETQNFTLRPGLLPSGVARTAPAASWATTDYWNFNASLSQLVWDFDQTLGRWRAARATADSQRETERATANQVVLNVRSAYFTARAGKDLVGVARETLANQEAHLRQIQGFVEVGTRPEIDLAQARTDRANAQVQLIQAENAYDTARAQLNQAMGVEGPTDYDIASETLAPVEGEELPLDPLVAEAIKARPDLASLDQQLRAQQETLGAVQGGYLPSLGVGTGFTEAGPQLDSMVWNWSATATLTWNLFAGGLTRAQAQEARANIDNVTAQVVALRQQLRLEIEQARLAVRASKAALVAAEEALVNARDRLRLAEGRYQTGAGSVIELGDAQVAMTQAGAQRVQAQYNLSTSRAQLLRALGRDGGSA